VTKEQKIPQNRADTTTLSMTGSRKDRLLNWRQKPKFRAMKIDDSQPDFKPYKPKIRKSGTGCVTMINDHLYEGRFTPTNAYGKREAHNIYAKTREECEEKLAAMIVQVKSDIKAEKERLKANSDTFKN